MIDTADIRIEDLPEDLQQMAHLVGLENTLKIVERFAGCQIYIPKPESVARFARDRRVIEEFNGCNHRQLALKYNLTESMIREILRQRFPRPAQDSLFG